MTSGNPRWDIFCRVVDNYGDIGVCWRLCAQLAARGHAVRLWVDDPSALQWMAPEGCAGVQVFTGLDPGAGYAPADVVIEAFGAPLAGSVIAAIARANTSGNARIAWINLEYLSAEPYVARSHGLASPVLGGAAAGVRKWFFFPGFTADTGGLLREPDLMERHARFDRVAWLARQGVVLAPGECCFSLFCYEPAGLAPWLQGLPEAAGGRAVRLLVTAGRATFAVRQALARLPGGNIGGAPLRITYLPALSQTEFDALLWSADLNFVRGEDSLVRALWAGAPFVWQAYPQDDGAHAAKIRAFLAMLDPAATAPPSLAAYFSWWNGAGGGAPPPLDYEAWRPTFAAARRRLLAQSDLLDRLQRFVAENR